MLKKKQAVNTAKAVLTACLLVEKVCCDLRK